MIILLNRIYENQGDILMQINPLTGRSWIKSIFRFLITTSNLNNFHSLKVDDLVSETQLQVGENSNLIIWRLKVNPCPAELVILYFSSFEAGTGTAKLSYWLIESLQQTILSIFSDITFGLKSAWNRIYPGVAGQRQSFPIRSKFHQTVGGQWQILTLWDQKKTKKTKLTKKKNRIVGQMWLGIFPNLSLFYQTCPVGPTLLGKTAMVNKYIHFPKFLIHNMVSTNMYFE